MTRGGPRDGYILVAVLGVMLLLTSLVAAGSLWIRSALDAVKVDDSDVAMSGLTMGGLELIAYQLFTTQASPDLIQGRRINFTDGTITPHIVDESGKVDLNESDPKLLASVFRRAGLDSQTANGLVARVVSFRGAKGQSTQQGDAGTQPTSSSASPSEKKPRRGFQSIDALIDLAKVSTSDSRALRPYLTVYNPDGKINILSASAETLAAIPEVSPAEVEVILARRKGASKRDAESLSNLLEKAKPYIKTTSGPVYTVRVNATSLKGHKKAINAVVAPSKSPNDPYYVLDWWE